MNVLELKEKILNSSFNRVNYQVSQDLIYLKEDLYYWSCKTSEKAKSARKDALEKNYKDVLNKITPKFQRDNNKWTRDMQIKFIENLIMGATSTIMLGSLTGEKSECILLDGLQRVTAIFDFMDNKFEVFENLKYNEENNLIFSCINNLLLRIYNFKNEKEMVQFYIDMNENITHSNEDIDKAKKYLKTL